VQSTVNGMTTRFVDNYVEWKSSTSDPVRYYYAGGVRVAMRMGADSLVWLVGDHLVSTSIAVNDFHLCKLIFGELIILQMRVLTEFIGRH
jgi:hypothetical protein